MPSSTIYNRRYAPAEEVVFQESKGEAALLHLASHHYFTLNQTATRIWQLFELQKDYQTVVQTLLTEYQIEENRLQQDIDNIIAKLVEKKLLIAID